VPSSPLTSHVVQQIVSSSKLALFSVSVPMLDAWLWFSSSAGFASFSVLPLKAKRE